MTEEFPHECSKQSKLLSSHLVLFIYHNQCLAYLCTCVCAATCWQAHDDIWRAIKRRGYEAEVPPLRQDASPIVVSISLTLMDVIDLVGTRC